MRRSSGLQWKRTGDSGDSGGARVTGLMAAILAILQIDTFSTVLVQERERERGIERERE